MRAIEVHEFGGPEVLVAREVPDPVAEPGQVVVRLVAADVIFLDTLLRGGWGGEIFPLRLPYVPGTGGAGQVESVGSGVDPTWVGRSVVVHGPGYAERVVGDVGDVVPVPDGLDPIQAAALMTDGVTALRLTRHAPAGADGAPWVLVAAAAGGAGSLAVQILRDAGARVVAAARGEAKLALARELGAEVAVDYSAPGWTARVRAATGGPGVALALDGAGGALGAEIFETVADGGRFVTYGTSSGRFTEIDPRVAEQRRIEVINELAGGPPAPELVRSLLEQVLKLAAGGRIRPAIGATFPLADAAAAHVSLAERATVGKSLLLI
ncbi:zinc-binding dehydrogenase [Promicromonospora kroppenstedtii]|uniref:Zinc-binding dehydrogenase n=1 Tax=Promicromonospora kroppenstedtii TaxID=440482 RepID=A0ABW7XLU7_9MICO